MSNCAQLTILLSVGLLDIEPFNIVPQLLINGLIVGSIYALAASGLALSYGVSRILNFAHGQSMMTGAYFFLFFSGLIGTGSWHEYLLSGVVSLTASGVLGALLYLVFILPFAAYNSLLPFIATVAAGKILENSVAILFGVNVRSISAETVSYDLGFGFVTPSQIFTITCSVCVLCGLAFVVHCTKLGRQMRAVQASPITASALGINPTRNQMWVFVIATALAGFAGILAGYETSLHPTMGGGYTVKALAVMVLGGLGNVWGTVIASFFLGMIETFIVGISIGSFSVPVGYRDSIAFILILGVLLFKPQGFLNRKMRGTA